MSETKALAVTPQSIQEVFAVAEVFYKSGLFKDIKNAAQASVKIIAGAELGWGPVASIRNVHVVEGNTSLHYSAIASQIRAHPGYDYEVVLQTVEEAKIKFFRIVGGQRQLLGESSFTMADAGRMVYYKNKQAHPLPTKYNWKQYPDTMLFARAMSKGARFYTPDVFNGPIYVPEELGSDFVDASYAVKPEPQIATLEEVEPEPQPAQPKPERPFDPVTLKGMIIRLVACDDAKKQAVPTRAQLGGLRASLKMATGGDTNEAIDQNRHLLLDYLLGHSSSKEITPTEYWALIYWLAPTKQDDDEWVINETASVEAKAAVKQAMVDQGQTGMWDDDADAVELALGKADGDKLL